ncbi:MAG: response regulator [Planctomycetales bacterium]
MISPRRNYRILIIDDNQAIHQDFRKLLSPRKADAEFEALEKSLFGKSSSTTAELDPFELSFASQGKQGYEMAVQAAEQGHPFAMAFVDMRMPPGWDGLEAIEHLWKKVPDMQVVICTAFTDHSWSEITQRLGHNANLLILKKPFDQIEIIQLATALCEKWEVTRQANLTRDQLERRVKEQTRDISSAYQLSLHFLRHVQWDWSRGDQNRALAAVDDLDRRMNEIRQYREENRLPELRRDPRTAYRTPVTLFLRTSAGTDNECSILKCWSHDLSSSGMSVIVNRPLREKNVIVFLDATEDDPIICEAEVVRTKQVSTTVWQYGLAFRGRAFKSLADKRPLNQTAGS